MLKRNENENNPKKKGTLISENGFQIVLKLWKKLIPSRNKSLIKFSGIYWNFEINELFFDLKNVVYGSQIST